jgi:4-hydroxy-tetrahydrodipicolinate reductase
VKIAFFGARGKVGSVLTPALEAAGHAVTPIARGDQPDLAGHDAALDFTEPDSVIPNVHRALEAGLQCVIGTSGFEAYAVDELARNRRLACFYAPNFAVGAVLMMRLAKQASEHLPRAEIVELHDAEKRDAPSGTAKATAQLLGGDPPIHSVRLPGLVAHQLVLLGGEGQLLTIRHDAFSREAYVPGVLRALERLHELPPGLTIGLDELLD